MLYTFFISFALLLAVWFIYPLFLRIATTLKPNKNIISTIIKTSPDVSIIIAAHNESKNLEKRCENIFSQDYTGCIEVVIASDGSNDNTIEVVKSLKNKFTHIGFIDIQPQGGRSNAHNLVVEKCRHEILIFTDAETVFDTGFISKLVVPFGNNKVGFASGTLKYFNSDLNVVSQSVSLYWKLEMFLRKAESQLGIYATGTGACCAVRKSLYRTIPETGDVDFITPLDSVLQGKMCIHVDDAIAWDELPDSPKREFNARIRMTSKNIHGTLKRWGIQGVLKHPLYTVSIFFHKLGRWLTPFFLITLVISNIFLLDQGLIYPLFFSVQIIFYFLGLMGFFKMNLLYSQQIYSFLLANLGFMLGVLKAIFGQVPYLYKPVAQQKK